jgi:tRNA G46 methylase TrmB
MLLLFFISALVLFVAVLFGNIYVTSRTRSYQLERQDMTPDQGKYVMEEYRSMVEMLADMNAADPFGYNATLEKFNDLLKPPDSILEVGFGRGDFSILLARKYPDAIVTGIDGHELSVRSAVSYYNS